MVVLCTAIVVAVDVDAVVDRGPNINDSPTTISNADSRRTAATTTATTTTATATAIATAAATTTATTKTTTVAVDAKNNCF